MYKFETMKPFEIQLFAFILAALVLSSCSPDGFRTSFGNASSDRVTVSLTLGDGLMPPGMKSSMLQGCEQVFSGAEVFIFYADNGLLDSAQSIPASAFDAATLTATAAISFPAGRKVRVYLSGNLWAIDKQDSTPRSLADALGKDFPPDETAFKDMSYTFGSRPIGEKYRSEDFSEVGRFGIPFSASVPEAVYAEGGSLNVQCTRLFARIRLTIDHSGLTDEASKDCFLNSKLHVRQANMRLMPFSPAPVKALGPEDVADGDCDLSMINSQVGVFDFYVPENMQGDLLPSNSLPSEKTYESIVSAYDAQKASLLTYMEFVASIDASKVGYGGEVSYRFYLGGDNHSNFDVCRGRGYDVTLGFTMGSLFNPSWKVTPDLTDSRSLSLSVDPAYQYTLPKGQMVAVRPSRSGRFYVGVSLGGSDYRRPTGLKAPSDQPSSLADCSITASFADGANAELSALGISASYNAETALMEFTVTDGALFVPGREIPLEIGLLPQGDRFNFTLKTFEDLSISWDRAYEEVFVPGMSRTATFKGYSSPVYYRSCGHYFADRPECCESALIPISYTDQRVVQDDKLKFYIFGTCRRGSLFFRPSDEFNDGNRDGVLDSGDEREEYTWVNSPVLEFVGKETSGWDKCYYLDMAGTGQEFCLRLRALDTTPPRTVGTLTPKFDIPFDLLDPEIADIVYTPKFHFSNAGFSTTEDALGNTVYAPSDGSESCIAVRNTGELTSQGNQKYLIFRNKIGSDYFSREDKRRAGSFTMYYGPHPRKEGSFFYTNSTYFDSSAANPNYIYFLPFLSKYFEPSFESIYDDYSLLNGERLDTDYSTKLSFDVGAASRSNLDYSLLDTSSLTLYALPHSASEQPYTYEGGKAGAFTLTPYPEQEKISLDFLSSPTRMHTAGMHDVYAQVTNIHSGEIRSEKIGSFGVRVHMLVGLDFEAEAMSNDSDAGTVNVFARIMSDYSLTSFDTNFEYHIPEVFTSTIGPLSYFNTFNPTDIYIEFFPESGHINAPAGAKKAYGLDYGGYDTLVEFSAKAHIVDGDNYSTAYNFMDDISSPESKWRFCSLFGPSTMGLRFKSQGNTSYGAELWDDVVFESLGYTDTDGKTKGYHQFHLLGNERRDCYNWIPLYRKRTE